jgi:hypothetical protein
MLAQSRVKVAIGVWLGMAVLLLTPGLANASLILFDDPAVFSLIVGPTTRYPVSSVPTMTGFSGLPFGFDDGSFPFQSNGASFELDALPGFNPLFVGDFSPRYPGNELAVKGQEELLAISFGLCTGNQSGNECIPERLFQAFGFNFVEPEHDIGATPGPDSGALFIDSLYEVALLRQGLEMGSFTFDRRNDVASFVGLLSSDPIDRVRIRELTNDPGDEYFGDFFIGQVSLPTIPEPSTILYLATGAVGLAWRRLRKVR